MIHSTSGAAATATFAALAPAVRVEVVRLAERGEAHPDAAVRLAAQEWATSSQWSRWYNLVPAWLLPVLSAVLGVLVVLLGVMLEVPWPMVAVLGVGALFAMICGLLGASIRSAAAAVRALTTDEPDMGLIGASGPSPLRGTFDARSLALADLFQEWDVLGIYQDGSNRPEDEEEYDDLVEPMRRWLESGATPAELFRFLTLELGRRYELSPGLGEAELEFTRKVHAWWHSPER